MTAPLGTGSWRHMGTAEFPSLSGRERLDKGSPGRSAPSVLRAQHRESLSGGGPCVPNVVSPLLADSSSVLWAVVPCQPEMGDVSHGACSQVWPGD